MSPDSVPTDLTATVGESNGMWTAPTTVHYTDHVRPDVPGIVVGSTLWSPEASQSIPVYFIFPETQEVAAVELLRRSVISVGALMALAIAVTTYLRLVIFPCRFAKRPLLLQNWPKAPLTSGWWCAGPTIWRP
ncbi:signal transduction histidine kinase [Cutibacterium acnes JCM 18916]|nr:signal transduction histidine kinase [Cutibacterium acnes JCM 18916]